MISEIYLKRFCSGEPKDIENYWDAINDKTQKWEIHHRKGLKYSKKELIKMEEYYLRPPEELIYLTQSEHRRLHNKGSKNPMYGKTHSNETKEKISKENKGKKRTAETRENLSKSLKGKPKTAEHCANNGKAKKGTHWYNNGIENKFTYDCPDGFVKGRLKNW